MSNIGDGIQVSELMDPLPQLSVLSFLPRASRDLRTNVSNSCNSNDLEFINDSMKLKDLKSPHKLLEQASAAIDGVSKLLDTNFSMLDTGENPNDTIREMRKGSVQDRRPGLGLKRPRFSMKPKSSQPVVLEPTLDIDKLEDPEEYFMAFEKRENARIELKRLRGFDLSDLDDHSPLRAEERRRPGLLGKTVHHYKHYSYGKDKKFVVSRETKEQEIMSSNHSSPEKAAPINESHEKGSIRESERRINKVLDELISDKCENLDMNGALSFLHEHLQIKPIDLDKLCLPDLPNVGKVDLNYNKENLVKPPKVSSVMENILKSIRDQTPKNDKPVLESPSSSIVSPTPPKNPFASTYLLKKSTVKSREKSHDMDVIDSDKPESTTILHHDNRNPAEIITCDSIHLSNKCSEMEDTDHVIRASNDTDILMIPNEMQDNVGDTPQEASAQCQHDTNVTEDISDKTPQKNKPVSGSPSSTIASPMLPKDPFASILLLKRSISKSTEKSHDAFTSLDPLSAREVSDAEHFDQRMIDSDNMESTMNEHVEITVVDRSPPQIIACDSVPLSNECLEMEDTDHFRGAANDNVILITHNEIKEKVVDVPQEALTQCQHGTEITKDTPMRNTSDQTEGQTKVQENVEDQSHDVTLANIQFPASRTSNRSKTSGISKRSKVSRTSKRSKTQLGQSSSATLSPHTAGEPSKSPVKVSRQDNTVGYVPQEALAQCQHDTNITKDTLMINTCDQTERQTKVQDVEDQSHGVILANIQFPASGTSKRSKTLLGQSSSTALSPHATGEPSVKVSGKRDKEPSLASQRNSKKPVNNGSKSKKLSRRQSLAEAGSSWTSGVRRSNRIKMRPLEFWKGERYLYGRVHESLTTVIGVKYMSPVKGDEKPTFKVKPFKDEYSELVEVAGLH